VVLVEKELTEPVVGAAIEVHRRLGPGLLEGIYRKCLIHELRLRGLRVQYELPLVLDYKGLKLKNAYRLDLLVEGKVVVELKAVQRVEPVFKAQTLTYMRLQGAPVGLLINFHVDVLRDGVTRLLL
jgi:GxxExxY protein